MDYKLALTTYGLILLAGLGDKTQLAPLGFSANSKSPWPVFIGASLALVTTSFVAVFLGVFIAKWVPENLIHRIAGGLFLLLGILLLIKN